MGSQLCIKRIYSKKGATNPRDMKSGLMSSFKRAPARKIRERETSFGSGEVKDLPTQVPFEYYLRRLRSRAKPIARTRHITHKAICPIISMFSIKRRSNLSKLSSVLPLLEWAMMLLPDQIHLLSYLPIYIYNIRNLKPKSNLKAKKVYSQ
jgi:hypothetical protein